MEKSIKYDVTIGEDSYEAAKRSEATAIAGMAATEGWRIVKDMLVKRMNALKEAALASAASVSVKDVRKGLFGTKVTVVTVVSDKERHAAAEIARLIRYVDAAVDAARRGA